MEPFYEDCGSDGFENAIDQNFRCQICLNVLDDPVQCRTKQHYFCSSCITRVLKHSQTCPLCREELTLEMLRPAPRIVTNVLSQLKYHYDNRAKACCDGKPSQSGILKTHVSSCGFCPVVCSNDGCFMIINKRDQELHETLLCGAKKLKCDDCGQRMQRKQFTTCGCALKKELLGIKTEFAEIKTMLKDRNTELDTEKTENYQLKCVQEKMMKEISRMKTELDNYQTIYNMKQAPIQVPYLNVKEDIVVAGGWQSNSVEMFSWSKRKWIQLRPMKERRFAAASVPYNNEMLVVGGLTGCGSYADSLEVMEMSQESCEWVDLQAKLPFKCHGHKCVQYQNHLFVIGGHNSNAMDCTDGIYEVLMSPPFSSKLVSRMPQPRCYHGVEAFDDKILIFGGTTTLMLDSRNDVDCVDSVFVYDINENQCEEMSPLPFPIGSMATARLGDEVILMGGFDNKGEALNAVVMYNVKTGESKILPPMRYKRAGCVAVVTGNVIVVMGGYNQEQSYLNSVECFSFVRETWEELPPMVEPRYRATAATKHAASTA